VNNYHQLQKPSEKCGQWQTSRTTKGDERRLAVIMHRIWIDGTEFRWTREAVPA
jgi:hypothetical protein